MTDQINELKQKAFDMEMQLMVLQTQHQGLQAERVKIINQISDLYQAEQNKNQGEKNESSILKKSST